MDQLCQMFVLGACLFLRTSARSSSSCMIHSISTDHSPPLCPSACSLRHRLPLPAPTSSSHPPPLPPLLLIHSLLSIWFLQSNRRAPSPLSCGHRPPRPPPAPPPMAATSRVSIPPPHPSTCLSAPPCSAVPVRVPRGRVDRRPASL